MAASPRTDARRYETVPTFAIPARRGTIRSVHPGPVVLVGALLFAPRFLDEYWIFNLCVGLTLAISCLGLAVLTGWARQISLMHAGAVGSATYLTTYVMNNVRSDVHMRRSTEAYRTGGIEAAQAVEYPDADLYIFAGMGLGIAFAVLIYAVVGFVARRLALLYVVVLTLAGQFALENYVFTQERLTGGLTTWAGARPDVLGISFQSDRRFFYLIAIPLLVLLVTLHRLRVSRYGRAIVFAGHEPEAAAAAGVAVWRYRWIAWVIAGSCAGLSGALQGPLYRNPPGNLQYISFNSLFYLAVAVLAGSASLLAVVVVAVGMTLLPQMLLDWKLNVYLLGGVGMVLGVLLGPRGVGGMVLDLFDHRRRR